MNRKMSIWWMLLIAVTLVGLTTYMNQTEALETEPLIAKEVYREAQNAVFYLRNVTESGTLRSVGTGFLLSGNGKAATAYHVVQGAASLEATLADGTVVKNVKVMSYDEQTDTAVLQLPLPKLAAGKSYVSLPLREEPVMHGERIFAIGYPLKNTPIITEGIVNAPTADINSRERILISAQIASGMSGGPVIDENGQLAGIVSGSLRTMTGIHLVASTKQLSDIMN
ncbi:S1 family peptidase [Paenibacillus agaridevorans]|uniref:S1 family peptidase n=1 Tax=Paenibacillus agaridevorans TaxID=171404 RepID=UPI001BE4057C|nr:serine protease [Paenibacillus agaridevorans]